MRHCSKVLTLLVAGLLALATACDKKDSDKSGKTDTGSGDEKASSSKSKSKSGSKVPFEATGPVAVVDGKEITADEFNKIAKDRFSKAPMPLPKSRAEQIKPKFLKSIVDKKLIEREIEKADIEVTKKEVEEEFEKFKENLPNKRAMQSFLKRRGLTKKGLKDKMKKDLALRKILREREGIGISDDRAKKYYENNPKKYEQPEKVKASHILVKTPKDAGDEEVDKARKKAESIAKEARKEGTDFSKLAKEKSEGPSAKKGGDLGFFTRDRMVEPFTEKAFSMKNGEISDPVKTEFGFHVIKRFDHKAASKKKFDEVKGDIKDQLERKKFRKALDKFISELREKHDVKEHPDNIKVTASAGGGMGGMLGGGGHGKGAPPALKKKLKKKLQKAKEKQQSGSSGGSEGEGGNLKLKKPESLKEE